MFPIFKYISLPVFLASFFFGLFFMMLYGVEEDPIYLYPSPDNIYDIVYKDKAESCYVYRTIMTKCTSESKTIKIQQ